MTADLIYVYCLMNTQPVLHETAEFRNLKSIVMNNFHVIFKYVSSEIFSEENFKRNSSDILWSENNTNEHIRLIINLMEQNTILPFKFGTIFNSEDNVRKFITDYSDSLIENIHHVGDKEELCIKVYCDRKMLSEQIDELSERTVALEIQIMASSPGKAFLLKRKKSELIENEMDRICKSYGQDYQNELRNQSVSTHLNNLLPKEFTGRQDSMILNAAFLVCKTKVNDFRNTVNILMKKDGDSGFFIETTGPWPTFSFICIKENLQ